MSAGGGGSSRTWDRLTPEAELGILLEQARGLLEDPGQGEFDLGIEPAGWRVELAGSAQVPALFTQSAGREPARVAAPRVVSTDSRVLFDGLAGVFTDLGFDAVGDEVFRDLVVARIVEPTSVLDVGRVLEDLGRSAASEKTMRRTLARCTGRGYRDQIARACFAHALASGDVSLCLYDPTWLNLVCS